jgi:glycosyltransferase involved in cell wall biosynthesis
MNIGILFEGKPTNPGGFNQSLNSALILNEINELKTNFTFITLDKGSSDILSKYKINTILYKNNILEKFLNRIISINLFKKILKKLNLVHSFSNFLKKNKFDMVIFLSPHFLSLECLNINFIINIWDLDHKKDSYFLEHQNKKVYKIKEKIINNANNNAYKIIVAHNENKKELLEYYNCKPEKILIQSFISFLPKFYLENKEQMKKENINYFLKYNISTDKKIIFYPASFWEHKNHKYILETANLLKKKSIKDFNFLFCGTDRGNLKFIKEEIKKYDLSELISTISFVSNEELVFFYNNSFAVVMPTIGGPTNLPLYESFFFKKPIFYNKNILQDEILKKLIIEIDVERPFDFFNKLIDIENINLEELKINAYEYYLKECDKVKFKNNYISILKEYKKYHWKQKYEN